MRNASTAGLGALKGEGEGEHETPETKVVEVRAPSAPDHRYRLHTIISASSIGKSGFEEAAAVTLGSL